MQDGDRSPAFRENRRPQKLSRDFTRVPNGLIRAAGFKPELKLTLIYLTSFNWGAQGCRPTQKQIARDLGIDLRTVRRHVRKLKDLGYVLVERQNGRSRTKYVLNLSSFVADTCDLFVGQGADTDDRHNGGAGVPSCVTSESAPNSIHIINDTSTDTHDAAMIERGLVSEALRSFGVNEPTRGQLAATCSLEQVRTQINWVLHRNLRDPAASLVAALRNQWAEPAPARSLRERAEEDKAARERAIAAKARVDAIQVDESAREVALSMLPQERYKFRDRAFAELGGRGGEELYGRDLFDRMVGKYTLHLIGLTLRALPNAN